MAHKIFLFGLDKAGKTALGHYIKTASCEETRPTLAFNIDKWVIDDIKFDVWDAPGQIKLRNIWKNGFNKAKILLFVLDTSEKDRFQEAKVELDKILNDLETRGIPLFFCFHKMDLSISQQNMNKAREIFKLPLISERPVVSFETTIKGCEAVEDLKKKLVEFIQEVRW